MLTALLSWTPGTAVRHVSGWTGIVAPDPTSGVHLGDLDGVPVVYVMHGVYDCWYAPHVFTVVDGPAPVPAPAPAPLPVPPVIARTRGSRGGRNH